MNTIRRPFLSWLQLLGAFLVIFLTACGGSQDPILGNPGAGIAPTVVATSPAASTPVVTGVAINAWVSATFSKPMSSATLNTASFTLSCPAGTPVAATVTYDSATQVATLKPLIALPTSTLCVATVKSSVKDTKGFSPLADTVWSFMTAPAGADTVRPTVTSTAPPAGSSSVATNAMISASFSEDMNPATISGASFIVTNVTLGNTVTGSVSYSVVGKTALFTPAAALASNATFTARITSGAADLAGNDLAGTVAGLPGSSDHAWTFSTGALADASAPTVTAVSPPDGTTGMCLTRIVGATFGEAMDASRINTTTFTVTDGGVPVAGSVTYDAASRVASFVPVAAAGFAASKTFVATVKSGAAGVKDLAGNSMVADRVWSFSTSVLPCGGGVNLGSAAAYGAFGGGAGVTNQGITTVVNGNLATTAACSLITGFHDSANTYTEPPLNKGAVNGSIFCGPPAPGTVLTLGLATQAHDDALAAWIALAAKPATGGDPGAGQLGGLTLPPGVYKAAGGTFDITTADLTLDGQNDANATWVFQMGSALTVGLNATPRKVLLINGAKAANVYWQVGAAARIEDGSTMVGTIIAPAGVTISTAGQAIQTTLTGRAIGLTASVTMVNTTIVAP